MTLDEIVAIAKPHNDLTVARLELESAATVMEQVADGLGQEPINMPRTADVLRRHARHIRSVAVALTGTMP